MTTSTDVVAESGRPDSMTSPAPSRDNPKAKRPRRSRVILRGIALPAVVLMIWQVICSRGVIPVSVMPSPLNIASAFVTLTANGQLLPDIKISMIRALLGFLLGGSVGLVVGIAAGFSRVFEDVVDPSVQMLRTIPHLAVTPLFILWFGLGEWSKVLLIALGAFFPLYINTYAGIRGADRKLFEVALTLKFNRWKQLRLLILPSALPSILLGLRLSIGVSWLGLVVAELMGASSGIGYLIQDASQFEQTAEVFDGIILFAVVGKASDSLVRLLERRLLRWRDSFIQ